MQKRKSGSDHNYVKTKRCKVICDYCKREFWKSNITNHIKKHLSANVKKIKKEIICHYCNIEFNKRDHLINHIKRCHEITEELKKIYYKCDFCCTYFKSTKWLSRHVKECHIKTKETVDIEENEFSDLIRNLKVLNSQSQADILAQAIGDTKLDFVPNIDLRKIKVLEKNNKSFLKCDLCSYKSTRIGFLKRHLISHSNSKEHECPHCHKKYAYIDNLKAHLKLFGDKGCIKTYNYMKKKSVKRNNKNSRSPNLSITSMDRTSFSADDSLLYNIIKDIPDELPHNISDIDGILNDKNESFNNTIKINTDPQTFVTQDGVVYDALNDCEAILNSEAETMNILLNSPNNNLLNEDGENVNKIRILSDITIKNCKETLLCDNNSNLQGSNVKVLADPCNGQVTESNLIENTGTKYVEMTLKDPEMTDEPTRTLIIADTGHCNINDFITNLNQPSMDDISNSNMLSPIYTDNIPYTPIPKADEEGYADINSIVNLNGNFGAPTDFNTLNLEPKSNILMLEYENEINNCVDMNNVLKSNYFEIEQETDNTKGVSADTRANGIDNERVLNEKIKKQNIETEKLFTELLTETTVKSFYNASYAHACTICNKKFARKCNLNEHVSNVHSRLEFICDKCGKVFKSRKSFVNHFKLHTKRWSVKCQICDAAIATTSLRVHMRKHNNEKPFLCLLCGERFKTHLSKKCHLTTYHLKRDEDKPKEPSLIDLINEIDDIDKPLIPIPPLLKSSINHLKKQYCLQEKSMDTVFHICKTCNKAFKARSSLKRHEKIHEKKVVCECGSLFTSKRTLLSHKIRIHNPKKYINK